MTVSAFPGELLLYLLLVVVVAAVGGLAPALFAAVSGSVLANYYFTPPTHTFTIADAENLLALAVFLVVGVVVSTLVAVANRRTVDAARARAEAETLAALSGTLAASDDPLDQIVEQLRIAFAAEAVAVLRESGKGWAVEASAGTPVPEVPSDGAVQFPVSGSEVLVVAGAEVGEVHLDIARLVRVAGARRAATPETRG